MIWKFPNLEEIYIYLKAFTSLIWPKGGIDLRRMGMLVNLRSLKTINLREVNISTIEFGSIDEILVSLTILSTTTNRMGDRFSDSPMGIRRVHLCDKKLQSR